MGNMRKKIAFLAGAISFDNQNRVIDGVLRRAAEFDTDVFIFTCFVNYDESEENKVGAFQIMELPDLTTYDGVIVMKNSIQYEPASNSLMNRIKESRIPAVSVDEYIDGMHNVGISDYNSQKRIVEHLIKKHHLTKINYVCGILQGKEGMERLQQYGYEIPKDIVVTGFDNDELSAFYIPSLTTVDRRQEMLGEKAVDLLFDAQSHTSVKLETQILYRESCGCNCQTPKSIRDLRVEYQNQCLSYEEALDALKSMELDLTGLESVEELCSRLKKYVIRSDMKEFYLCLCDEKKLFAYDDIKTNIREQAICEHYTQKVHIPLAYHDRKFDSYGKFPSKEILPYEMRNKLQKTFYIVTPIYYQKICYGYCVSDGSVFALKSELAYLWTVNIGMALENIRKWKWINQMNEKINRMWKYDMLTQVFNRSGFFYSANAVVERIKGQHRRAFMIFLDIDGLKSVNDGLGHKVGDAFIREMADVIKASVPKDCLVMRYGGDEFVVFGSCTNAKRMQMIVSKIKNTMEKENQNEKRIYQLSASIGCSVHASDEIDDLNQLIESADKRMYEEKKEKHMRR